MGLSDHKKRKIIIGICIVAGVCLAGAGAAVIFVMQRNPLAKGLANLAKEVTALEAELGGYFWTDTVNQIGSESIQAEYSLNIGGIPELQNNTVGVDGRIRRDMEEKLLDAEINLSVANAEISEVSFWGTSDALYLQMPSVWEGNVALNTENVSGQWNGSEIKKKVQQLAKREFGIDGRVDVDLFERFSTGSFSVAGFLEKNEGALRNLYENAETMKVEKAQEEGIISDSQAEVLRNDAPENGYGEKMDVTCYLVTLPGEYLRALFQSMQEDVRLAVFLDPERRIVRIRTLPGEMLVADKLEGEFFLNLTGAEATTDRLEFSYVLPVGKYLSSDLSHSWLPGISEIARDLLDTLEVEGTLIIEKNRETTGAYHLEYGSSLGGRENLYELSLEGNVEGERIDMGEKLSVEVKNCVLKLRGKVVFRGSGRTVFMPLAEEIQMPEGREYRIGEMSGWETALFWDKCVENIHKNYSGYLRLLEKVGD